LPSEANAVVINVETLTRIVEAVEQKRPVISKNITVVGQLNSGLIPGGESGGTTLTNEIFTFCLSGISNLPLVSGVRLTFIEELL
ncbi:hypothetical protein ACTPEF_25975, partial [Clostridioides difficile]